MANDLREVLERLRAFKRQNQSNWPFTMSLFQWPTPKPYSPPSTASR